jgi:hypothetical protein
MSNPFNELYSIIAGAGEKENRFYYIGIVDSISPFKISFMGIQLSKFLYNSGLNCNVGDRVLILNNGQQFIVLCKLSEV